MANEWHAERDSVNERVITLLMVREHGFAHWKDVDIARKAGCVPGQVWNAKNERGPNNYLRDGALMHTLAHVA